MWEEKIRISGPYDFNQVLRRLSIDPLHSIDHTKRIIKVPIYVHHKPMVVTVQGIGTIDKPIFLLQGEEEEEKEAAIERVCEIFHFKTSITAIHEHFQGTDLQHIFVEHYGTPLVLDFDPYSCLLKCIIHQQLNMTFAHTLSERFVKTFGTEIHGAWFYPQPAQLAHLQVEQLRELQFSGRKAEYVLGIAKKTASGELDFNRLKTMSDEAVFNELIKIRGVGPWTIENFLMFGLGRPNLFPKADIGIQNALRKQYNLDRKPTYEEMEQYSKEWEPYLSYASLYLWRSIE
ncbi:DNA-3-methyladenine glycosylase [Bacillus aquiflavi]|uniref:DNA-3-methyladenine glycosylase family protein n=1 Tax=Bacillus aquiflavi TaxID=2672567 RepID=UPI001CA964C0|nr:DNA-3-methyladenine glycosylase [Bacillus aquiflavi]UAC48802.1 DNA-3-methyladenine glycosylase [Bacillus aquiflavi]